MPDLLELILNNAGPGAEQTARAASRIDTVAGLYDGIAQQIGSRLNMVNQPLFPADSGSAEELVRDELGVLERRTDGWRRAAEQITKSETSLFQSVRLELGQTSQLWDGFSDSVQKDGRKATDGLTIGFTSLSGFFKGEVTSGKNLWKGFCDFLASVFARTLSRMVSNWLSSGISGLFNSFAPGGGFSSGELFTVETPAATQAETSIPGLMTASAKPAAGSSSKKAAATAKPAVSSKVVSANATQAGTQFPETGGAFVALRLPAVTQREFSVVHPVAAGQPASRVPAREAGGSQPLNVEINIENRGLPIEAEKGPVRLDGEKTVVGLIIKNYSERGAIYDLVNAQKR